MEAQPLLINHRYRDIGVVDPKTLPEEWASVFRVTYEELRELARELGLEIVLAGAWACSAHVEHIYPTKDIDYVLSKPVDIRTMIDLLNGFTNRLEKRGVGIVGRKIQQGRSSDDWVAQIFIAVSPVEVLAIEVFNLLAVRPLALYETEVAEFNGLSIRVLTT